MGSLVACVSHAGQRLRYSLGLSHIPVRYWDDVRQRIRPRNVRCHNTMHRAFHTRHIAVEDRCVLKQI